mgnify:FL=1
MQDAKWVCLTGATGFIAGHVLEELLKGGHNVRATVRNPADRKKVGHLLQLGDKYKKTATLELHKADLVKEGSFDKVLEGRNISAQPSCAIFPYFLIIEIFFLSSRVLGGGAYSFSCGCRDAQRCFQRTCRTC